MLSSVVKGLISALSLVTNGCEHTAGASMTRQPSSLSHTVTPLKGLYHSLALGPFRRRRAM